MSIPRITNNDESHFHVDRYVNSYDFYERDTYEIVDSTTGAVMSCNHEDGVELIDIDGLSWTMKEGRLALDYVLQLLAGAEEYLLDDDPELLEDYFKRIEEEEKAAKAEPPES
ncbi:hypothetical protein E3E12_07830 [Formicincola oecophyllae]|uniref:Uncharacterized protein n=1 Tax=Formicincola oecophyllae TaxID=2558361 RepID=A0A4Y6UDK5_9PROT|nr:hypothetical protein [Formicincola oecophyllae]QDH14105.1 hypothetical protein E3E12_07830 [Formicincola oecophyllae]